MGIIKGQKMKKLILIILCCFTINYSYAFTREETLRLQQKSLLTVDTIMLGDSITAMGPWNDLLNNKDIVNRGISADTTLAILSRLNTLPKIHARRVFLMIGINDLRAGATIGTTFNNYVKIVESLQSMGLEVIIQSTLRCNLEFAICKNSNYKVDIFNQFLRTYSKSAGIKFIELNTILANGPRGLRKEYTVDGLHLNMLGYEKWTRELINEQ